MARLNIYEKERLQNEAIEHEKQKQRNSMYYDRLSQENKERYETKVQPYLPLIKKWVVDGRKDSYIAQMLGITITQYKTFKKECEELRLFLRASGDVFQDSLLMNSYRQVMDNNSSKNNALRIKLLETYHDDFKENIEDSNVVDININFGKASMSDDELEAYVDDIGGLDESE